MSNKNKLTAGIKLYSYFKKRARDATPGEQVLSKGKSNVPGSGSLSPSLSSPAGGPFSSNTFTKAKPRMAANSQTIGKVTGGSKGGDGSNYSKEVNKSME